MYTHMTGNTATATILKRSCDVFIRPNRCGSKKPIAAIDQGAKSHTPVSFCTSVRNIKPGFKTNSKFLVDELPMKCRLMRTTITIETQPVVAKVQPAFLLY